MEFKQVPSFDGYYVGNDGWVYSNKSGTMKLLASWLVSKDVVYLKTRIAGKQVKIHQLVASVWHGPMPPGCTLIRHLNGVGNDNRPENLKYGTHKENCEDTKRHNDEAAIEAFVRDALPNLHIASISYIIKKPKSRSQKINFAIAEEIRALYATGKFKQFELADQFGIAKNYVSEIITFKKWVVDVAERIRPANNVRHVTSNNSNRRVTDTFIELTNATG